MPTPTITRIARLGLLAPGLLTLGLLPPVLNGSPTHDRALATLHHAWAHENDYTRMRAGEALVLAGAGAPVRADLLVANPMSYPVYVRVLALRVLVHAAPDAAERAAWTTRIRDLFMDRDAPDRLHALESLTKLGDVPTGAELEEVRTWLASAPEPARPFGHWRLHLAGDPAAEPALLEALRATDAIARLRAAFVLRMIQPAGAGARAAVSAALAQEPADSPARPYLLSAALRLVADPAQAGRWREEALASFLLPGRAVATLELAPVITHLEPPTAVEIFLALLDHPEADARIGGAKALLGQNHP